MTVGSGGSLKRSVEAIGVALLTGAIALGALAGRTASGPGEPPVLTPDPIPTSAPTPTPTFDRQEPVHSPSPTDDAPPPGPQPSAAPRSEPAPDPPRSQRYHFEATLDYEAGLLDVVQTLEWTNTSTANANHINLSVIPVHIGAFALTGAVTVNGVVADAQFVKFETNLRVRFHEPLPPDHSVTIVLPFRLTVGTTDGAFGSRLSKSDGVMQFGEWFPIWSTVHGFHDPGDPQVSWTADSMTLDLTSSTDLGINAVAASGRLLAGATPTHWVFQAENVRDFAFAAYPGYSVRTATTTCDGQPIEVRAYVKDASAREFVSHSLHAMDSFNDWFGCYDYDTFSIVETSGQNSMEFPTLVFISADEASNPSIIYHEVAHQWWYAMVGNDQLNEPWLDEAFAQYSMRLLDGRPIRQCPDAAAVGSSVYDFDRWQRCAYVATVYQRGSALLQALHQRMGDDDFFAALRRIVETYRHGMATTDGVIEIFQASTNRNLRRLFTTYGVVAGDA
jgi:hypothetical protein